MSVQAQHSMTDADDAPLSPSFANVQRAGRTEYAIGEFRAWAGYKNLGSDDVTDGLVHFQHVLSFADTAATGRTGIHAHLAYAHIVIPTSGRAVFSYDGIATEAVPGAVIVQHGGTIHDQYDYSYAAASAAENRATPLSVEPVSASAPLRSFGFLELFVPQIFANVEIVPPAGVTPDLEKTAWAHPYHLPGAGFSLQAAGDPSAAYHPLVGRPGLEVRDCDTWGPSAGLVATWIIRSRTLGRPAAEPLSLAIPGEANGVIIIAVISGQIVLGRQGGEQLRLKEGDTLTCSEGWLGDVVAYSTDLSLVRFYISSRARDLPRQTPEEIAALEALGAGIITGSEVRADGDARPVNCLREV